jgi:hypothetical protein
MSDSFILALRLTKPGYITNFSKNLVYAESALAVHPINTRYLYWLYIQSFLKSIAAGTITKSIRSYRALPKLMFSAVLFKTPGKVKQMN